MRLKTFNLNCINLENKDYNYYKNYNNINKILKKLSWNKNKKSFYKIHKQILSLKLLIHQKKENIKILLVIKNLCKPYNKKLNYLKLKKSIIITILFQIFKKNKLKPI